MKKVVLLVALVSCVNLFGSGAKMIKVDLDQKGTQLVKAELDLDDTYYYIDTTACLCWVAKIIGGSSAIAVFDCKNLMAYPKLEEHLSKCSFAPKPIIVEPVVVEELKVEVKEEDKNKEDKKGKKDKKDKKDKEAKEDNIEPKELEKQETGNKEEKR